MKKKVIARIHHNEAEQFKAFGHTPDVVKVVSTDGAERYGLIDTFDQIQWVKKGDWICREVDDPGYIEVCTPKEFKKRFMDVGK